VDRAEVRKAEEAPGLLGRAIDVDRELHRPHLHLFRPSALCV
jgi:hypothetical protein